MDFLPCSFQSSDHLIAHLSRYPLGAKYRKILCHLDSEIFIDKAWPVTDLTCDVHSSSRAIALAEADGEAIGFIVLDVVTPQAEILKLGILPTRQGLGWGRYFLEVAERALYESCASTDKAVRLETIFLEVSDQNKAARRLYFNAGYRQIGHRADYYEDGSDALVMRKKLARRTIYEPIGATDI